ncbi:MAG: hypothetical protein JSV62_12620 [Promethearchaeota archaeon]|nr:MAG: hypothetical protein JSV62_12620 [Candidatus Lokiarchaeota archaeon]
MALNPLDVLNGVFSLIFVVISLFVGLVILTRYFKYKEKIYFLVGSTYMLISSPWWPSCISFLVAISNGVGIPSQVYFLIGNVLTPIAIVLWLLAFTEFLYTEKRKLFLLIFTIIGVIFEILFFIFLFLNPSVIGQLNGPVDVNYESFIMIFLIIFLSIVVISGFLFANLSLKSKDPEVKLKGKLLIIAYVTFAVGALLDSAIPLNEVLIIITRLILIASAICWYGGFILPKWMKKFFLRKPQ